jgi:transposase InsO family protein
LLRQQIIAVFEQNRRAYGSPRITAALHLNGVVCNHKPVEAIMREAQLAARPARRRRSTTAVKSAETVAGENILARDFTASAPNTRWLVDMTMLPTRAGWLYLAAVLDLYSRKIVGYATGDTATEALAVNALTMALSTRQPPPGLLHHSDRGSPYRANRYARLLALHQATISMSRPHTCWDNAPMESFFSTLKAETDSTLYDSHLQARVAVFDYIETFYNRVRLHSSLGYRSPEVFERGDTS